MLASLLYVSTAVGPQTTEILSSIQKHAKEHNVTKDITGILGQGRGLYLQVLEGPRPAVNELYKKICNDPRHTRVEILSYEHITERKYGAWSMALIDLSKDHEAIPWDLPDFDPYRDSDVDLAEGLMQIWSYRISID